MPSWDFPYPSRRMPVLARNCVATTQPLAAQAGLLMLQKGGNAVDAAIATAIALTVVEPINNGLGSDSFAIIWDGAQLRRHERLRPLAGRLDARPLRRTARCRMRAGTPQRSPAPSPPGWRSAGASAACPSRRSVEPAIRYARDGFLVSPDRRADLGEPGGAAEGPAGLRRDIPAARPRAEAGRAFPSAATRRRR